MTTRQNFYAESLAESTSTSATYADKVVLTFTPDASSEYYLIGTARINCTATTSDVQCRLRDDTGATTLRQYLYELKDASKTGGDYESVAFLVKHTSGGSPPSQTFSIEYAVETATSTTAAIKDATLIAIKKAAGDEYAEKTSNTVTTSATLQDDATLTFTPATSGDYLIVATAEVTETSGTATVRAVLDVDGTLYADATRAPKDPNNVYSWATLLRITLSAASHTIKIQTASPNGVATVGIFRGAVLALRLDQLANNYYNESRTRATTTNTSYVDGGATITQTPVARDHVIFAAELVDSSSTSSSVFGSLNKGGSTQTESLFESLSATAGDNEHANFHVRKETLAASSTTWKMQHKVEASVTCGFADSAIAILDLEEAAAPPPTVNSNFLALF